MDSFQVQIIKSEHNLSDNLSTIKQNKKGALYTVQPKIISSRYKIKSETLNHFIFVSLICDPSPLLFDLHRRRRLGYSHRHKI